MNQPEISLSTLNRTPTLHNILEFLTSLYPPLVLAFKTFIGIFVGISFPLSIFFIIVIVYCVEQLKKIRTKEKELYDTKVEPAYEPVAEARDVALSKRWDSVKKHIESQNENDWRQAIMDADIILDDLLNKMGYRGESVGEKLKRVEPGDFVTLNDAWEAHKVRNQIAHEGTHFVLNHHDAKHVIDRYRRVFEEFYYIKK